MKASENFKKRLEAGCATIISLIAAYEADGRNLINNLIDEILKVLIDYGLAYRQRLKPQFVGVHKCNRGGTGLISSTIRHCWILSSVTDGRGARSHARVHLK